MKFATLIATLLLTLGATSVKALDTEITDHGELVRLFTDSNPELSSHGLFSLRKDIIACVMCEKAPASDGFFQVWITTVQEGERALSLKYKFAKFAEAVEFADKLSLTIGKGGSKKK